LAKVLIVLTMLAGQSLSAQTHITMPTSNPLTWYTQTGTGMSGKFEIKNTANANTALYAATNGSGPAGSFNAGGSGYGVLGQSASGIAGFFLAYGSNDAVYGESTSGNGGAFFADIGGYGVYGESATGPGGYFVNTDNQNYGVYGEGGNGGFFVGSSGGSGVYAAGGTGGTFVAGANGNGVYGEGGNGGYFVANASGNGVYGESSGCPSAGVYGYDADGVGVYGLGGVGITGASTDTVYNLAAQFWGNVNVFGNLKAQSFITASDARYKTHVATLTRALDKVLALRGVTYDWRTEQFPDKHFGKGQQVGFIAQEVEKILPQIVSKDPDGYRAVDYSKVVPVLVEAIKEQQSQIKGQAIENREQRTQITEQQVQIKEQAQVNHAQEQRIAAIEAQMRQVQNAAFSGKAPALGALLALGAGGSLALLRRRRKS
jgi:hypothetical protein